MTTLVEEIDQEMQRRRTFAIISHPDAGKTTITEKLLLLGGAIRLAGSVKAKKNKKFATSDWMELEKQRGISVSTSVMNFEYQNFVCNLLDTPGHQDFSEDTYRTLTAVDAAIMLLDGAKGVEPQTIKLFEVCKLRGIPIFTFINKMDRETRPVFELLEEVESVLGIQTYPMTWPVGCGDRFKGVIERETQMLHYFEGRNTQTETKAQLIPLDSEEYLQMVPENMRADISEDLDMLSVAGNTFSYDAFKQGLMTPVFFGSAMNNFGVRAFLDAFLKMAPPPIGKGSSKGVIDPLSEKFSGFVFKIQANMDPKHRDRIAFLRVVSGQYKTGLMVHNMRLGREIKLSPPQQFFGQERSALETAYPGDIVGMYDPGLFAIGDTLCFQEPFEFEGIPSFAPEYFCRLRVKSAFKRKQLFKGLIQLCQEGAVQMFVDETGTNTDPVLAAVGSLQFDVLVFRLQNEYNVECAPEVLGFKYARWTDATDEQLEESRLRTDCPIVRDMQGNALFLFKNDFHLDYFQEHLPQINLYKTNAKLRGNMMKTASSYLAD